MGSVEGSDDPAQAVAASPAVTNLGERVAHVETQVDDLEEYMYDWTEHAELYILAFRRLLEERLDVNMRSYVEDVAEERGEGGGL